MGRNRNQKGLARRAYQRQRLFHAPRNAVSLVGHIIVSDNKNGSLRRIVAAEVKESSVSSRKEAVKSVKAMEMWELILTENDASGDEEEANGREMSDSKWNTNTIALATTVKLKTLSQ